MTGEACCTFNATVEAWQNVWSLSNPNGDRIITADAYELSVLLKDGWVEVRVCVYVCVYVLCAVCVRCCCCVRCMFVCVCCVWMFLFGLIPPDPLPVFSPSPLHLADL